MAQSISGTNLLTNWQASYQVLSRTVEIKWDGSNWTDETSRVIGSIAIKHSLLDNSLNLAIMGAAEQSTASVSFDNSDGRFSVRKSGSIANTYYPNGVYRVPIRIYAGLYDTTNGDEELVQFFGYIENITDSERVGQNSALASCIDLRAEIDQNKHTTTLYENKRPDEWIYSLAFGRYSGSIVRDQGVFTIPACWTDKENIWSEVGSTAESERGVVYINKDGTLTFRRATFLVEQADSVSSQATLTRGRLTNLSGKGDWRNTYGEIEVSYEPRTRGLLDTIYEAQEPIEVEPNDSVEHIAELRWPTVSVETPIAGVDYDAVNGGTSDMSSSISISYSWYAERASVTFTNSSSQRVYILNFQLRGIPLIGEGAQSVDTAAESPAPMYNVSKSYTARKNPYRQTREQAEYVAYTLRDLLQYPRELWSFSGPLCPWLELGDRITVQSANQGLNEDMYVMSLSESLGSSSQMMDLVLLPVSNVYAESSFFIIGSDTYGGSDKVYY